MNVFVASSELESPGTRRQSVMVILMPSVVYPSMVPSPSISVLVMPSARVTCFGEGHGWKFLNNSGVLMSV